MQSRKIGKFSLIILGVSLGTFLLTTSIAEAYTPRYLDEQMRINLKEKKRDIYTEESKRTDLRPFATVKDLPLAKSIGILQGTSLMDIDEFTAQIRTPDRTMVANVTMTISGVNYEKTYNSEIKNGYAVFNFDLWNYTGKYQADYSISTPNENYKDTKVFYVIKKVY